MAIVLALLTSALWTWVMAEVQLHGATWSLVAVLVVAHVVPLVSLLSQHRVTMALWSPTSTVQRLAMVTRP
jgi:hypothetical protein